MGRTVIVGVELQRAREAKGFTQEQLARTLGVATRTVSRWEQKLSKPQAKQREALIKILYEEVKPAEDTREQWRQRVVIQSAVLGVADRLHVPVLTLARELGKVLAHARDLGMTLDSVVAVLPGGPTEK